MNGVRQPAALIDDLRASALVDVQLEAGAKLIMPPVPTDVSNIKTFHRALERTTVSIQTFDESCEIVGHIPTTDRLDLVRDMVEAYTKKGTRFFSTDFSGASNRPALMRTVVGAIRKTLKIKRKANKSDETYYLHVFNASAAKKSVETVTPLSDIIIHPYGVDSTSGVMWGGGTLDVEKLRYYDTGDYGSYRRKAILAKGTSCACRTCSAYNLSELYSGSPAAVVDRLKSHRAYAYADECVRIAERIGAGQPTASYTPYLMGKTQAVSEVQKILQDVNEVRASL